jgi:hypothetical protein
MKFFRKIREMAISSGKVKNYLLYAVGEIMLVVIGIYIAIQLNNLNENRKLKSKEATYYCKLLEDVKQDELQLTRLIRETDERIFHSNKFLGLLQQKELDPRLIANEMFQSVSSFEDIKSSGNIGLLNEEIKENLITYYTNIEGIVDVVDTNADQSVKLSYQKESYSKFGWQLIDRIDEAIDEQLVDKAELFALVNTDEEYRAKLTSDGIYFISAGSRVKMLYEGLIQNVIAMRESLENKCSKLKL